MSYSLIIAGSRTVSPTVDDITNALNRTCLPTLICSLTDITEVVCGTAKGADQAGAAWARSLGIAVHYEPISDDLVDRLGRYLAPKMRNRRMAERADGAIVFWDGTSGGSADMVCRMVARDKFVRVIPWPAVKKRP